MSTAPTDKAPPKAAYRPLSPHLQIWRWHITMASSILHRVSGSAAVAGVVLLVAWLLSLALTASGVCVEAYTVFLSLAASPLGLLVWFGLTLAAFVHLAGGVRHLIWDLGIGFTPKTANLLSYLSLIFAVVATIAFWVFLFASGKVTL